MPRNGSGTMVLPSGNPFITGTTISSTTMNNTMADIATAISGSISADGQTPITQNIPMSGHIFTGLGATQSANIPYTPSGAGAVPLPVSAKLQQYVSVVDFMTQAQIAAVQTAASDTSWAFGVGSDCTAAFNAAFAVRDALVYIPPGGYIISSNLATPVCAGIFGAGWMPGPNYRGSVISCGNAVTTLLDLYGTTCLHLSDFEIIGNSTPNAYGIVLGNRSVAPYTWDYGEISNVRISMFNGSGGNGLICRNINFCSFYKLFIDNCDTALTLGLAAAAAGTVPADCYFTNCNFSSTVSNGVVVNSASNVVFTNTKIAGTTLSAININPFASYDNQHGVYGLLFENTNMENIYNTNTSAYQINVSGFLAANTAQVIFRGLQYETNHVSDPNPKLIHVSGAYANVVLEDLCNAPPTVADTTWILAENYAKISAVNWGLLGSSASTGTWYNLTKYTTALTNSIIEGDGCWTSFTPALTGITGSCTPTGSYNRKGNMVFWQIALAFSGASSAPYGGSAFIQSTAGAPDLGRPMPSTSFTVDATSSSLAQTFTGTGLVANSGGKFTCYLPGWTAASAVILYFSGTYFCDNVQQT